MYYDINELKTLLEITKEKQKKEAELERLKIDKEAKQRLKNKVINNTLSAEEEKDGGLL